MPDLRSQLELRDDTEWPASHGRNRLLLVGLNVGGYYSLPIRTLCLVAHHSAPEFESRYYEATLDRPISELHAQLQKWSPDIIAFSANIWNMEMITQLAPRLKKGLPGLTIVCGGQEVTNSVVDHLQLFPALDYIIEGEGEKPLAEFLAAYSPENRSVDVKLVSGLRYRDGAFTRSTGPARLHDALDEIPSAILAGLAPGAEKAKLSMGILLEGTRACPFRCAFCFEGQKKEKTRFNSIERLTEEALYLATRGVSKFHMLDPILCASRPERLAGLNNLFHQLRAIQKRAFISVEAYADLITDQVADNMTTCSVLDIGLQSINPQTTKALNRPFKEDKWKMGVERLRVREIPFNVYLISGLPHETLGSFLEGIDFVLRATPTRMFFNELCLLNGTELRVREKEYGYRYDPLPPYRVRGNRWMPERLLQLVQVAAKVIEKRYNLSARVMFSRSPWAPRTDSAPGTWREIQLTRDTIVEDDLTLNRGQRADFEGALSGSSLYVSSWEDREATLRFVAGFQLAGVNRMKVHIAPEQLADRSFTNNLVDLGVLHFSTSLELGRPERFAQFRDLLSNLDPETIRHRGTHARPPVEVFLDGPCSARTAREAVRAAGIGPNIILTFRERPDDWAEDFPEVFEEMIARGVWLRPHEQDLGAYLRAYGARFPETRLIEDEQAILQRMGDLGLALSTTTAPTPVHA